MNWTKIDKCKAENKKIDIAINLLLFFLNTVVSFVENYSNVLQTLKDEMDEKDSLARFLYSLANLFILLRCKRWRSIRHLFYFRRSQYHLWIIVTCRVQTYFSLFGISFPSLQKRLWNNIEKKQLNITPTFFYYSWGHLCLIWEPKIHLLLNKIELKVLL